MIETQIPQTNLEEARNIFSFLQVPGALGALKVIMEAGSRGAGLEEIEEYSRQIARSNIDRLTLIGIVIPDDNVFRINPAMTPTAQRILFALFPPVTEMSEPAPQLEDL